MIAIILSVALAVAQAGVTDPQPDDIVVTAVRQQCRVRLADQDLTDREFDDRAREWAGGKPVRVFARANADIKCLSKIAFKLADRGVRRIEFIDPTGAPAQPFPRPADMAPMAQPDLREREHNFVAAKAARLILDDKCADARQLALEAADLDTAANVAVICQQH